MRSLEGRWRQVVGITAATCVDRLYNTLVPHSVPAVPACGGAPRRTLAARWGVWCLAAIAAAAPAAAWGPDSQVTIAREAANLAPPDLQRQLERHADRLREGALAPFRGTAPERHYRNRDAGALEVAILEETRAAIAAIRQPAPFEEIVYRLGVLGHYVADANNPLNSSGDDAEEARYFADYLRYSQSAERRFALVFYAGEPAVESENDVRLLVLRALHRGRKVYPLVGAEYRRIGFGSGVGRFDDRSTAFGVAAVSFSHAVSDLARVLRYVWLQGGGADPRQEMWSAERPRLLLLPRTADR